MKHYFYLLIFLTLNTALNACPTCIGDLHDDAPLFFSEEFYDIPEEAQEADTQSLIDNQEIEEIEENR